MRSAYDATKHPKRSRSPSPAGSRIHAERLIPVGIAHVSETAQDRHVLSGWDRYGLLVTRCAPSARDVTFRLEASADEAAPCLATALHVSEELMLGRSLRVLVVLVGVVSLVSCAGPDLQAIADDASEERFGNGFAVVVTDSEGNRTVGVAGTLVDGTPMDSESPWVIGSVAKAFVATTVMQLVDEGVLSLDDRATEYLDFGFIPEKATVFDLLHHSSGIPDYITDEWVTLMKSCPIKEPHPYDFVDTTPLFEPGTDWSYGNVNYLLLGELVQVATGNPIETEMRSRILDPLGLEATYVMHVETGPTPMAAGQDFFDTGPGPLSDCKMEWHGGPAPVDGFMVSSVRDLDVFYRALFGGELVSDTSLEAMMSQEYVGAEYGQGLGLIHLVEPPVEGVNIYANGGGIVGYKTLLMIELNTMTTIVAVSPGGFAFENQQDDILRWAFG